MIPASYWHIDPLTLREVVDNEEGMRELLGSVNELDAVWILRVLGELPEALRRARAALVSNPDTSRAAVLLADILVAGGQFGEAEKLHAKALDIERGTRREATVRQHSGKRLFDQSRYAEAQEQFQIALDLRRAENAAESLIRSSELALARVRELQG
jgi:tetratricopeptide (TPR) repeat protein